MKAPKSCHITTILRCLHWLRITERIEYKLLSLTYKVRTTTQPPYLHNLISIQRPRSTRSSSVVTLARPPSSSCLKITDRSFRYASPCLWNQLPLSLRKPHSGTSSSASYSPIPTLITSSCSASPYGIVSYRCPTNTEQFRRQRLFCCRTQNLERSTTGTATRRHQLWTIQTHAEIVSL